jgi:hypothetical protein
MMTADPPAAGVAGRRTVMAIDPECLRRAKHDGRGGRFVLVDGLEVQVKRIASCSGTQVIASVGDGGDGTGVLRRFALAEIVAWHEAG